MTGTDRSDALDSFKKDSSKSILFLTYGVGAESINVIEAEYIILMDTTWTHSTEEQATSRSHRVGQTNKVTIFKLMAVNTIENKMQDICSSKQKLFETFINKKGEIQMDSKFIGMMLK